jgi:O-antigen ligase
MSRALPGLLASLLVLFGLASSVSAQDVIADSSLLTTVLFPVAPPVPLTTAANAAISDAAQPRQTFTHATEARRQGRPALLPALYAAQGALQAMDAHSTFSAIRGGAHEANPLMKGVASNTGAMVAVKAGVAAGTIWMAESMWKRGNRAAALATMLVANGVAAVVVAHNYQLAHQLQ